MENEPGDYNPRGQRLEVTVPVSWIVRFFKWVFGKGEK